ncbi:MBL fold metallo-hydrolase [Aquimarina sp. AU474]|uniref:MBL fold metallo-hydrolase n=1 Tax=Aquimarina sp. AU474 TaxID=2108529 RepID=UPI00135A018D|nr:MBL fold metallo-hydrolase [Aquimarina sp. AU474]
MRHIVLVLSTFLFSILGISQESISITYTGNMGVHIIHEQSSVLIDGLHTKYGDDYLFPSKDLVHKINYELKPDAILFTHHHGDHFSSQLSKNYLELNRKAVLFGAHQITKNFTDHRERIFTITTKDYIKQTTKINDFSVSGVKINHAGKRHVSVENVGYIVNFNGKKVLHVGDTNWLEEINLFNQLRLVDESIDIAIIPYWMLLHKNTVELLKKNINPKHVVATHISPKIPPNELVELKRKYPKIYFLTTLDEQIQIPL